MDNPMGYVSQSVKRIKKRLGESQGAEAFKDKAKQAVDTGVNQFLQRMQMGQIPIANVNDFEKLVKLGLLLHGEATEKIEHTTDVEEVHEDHLHEITGTEEFEKIKKMLAMKMNKENEAKG